MPENSPVRHDKIIRYKPPPLAAPGVNDATSDYMNVLGIIFSMMGLMMKMKWCSWIALLCSSVTYANSRVNDDGKQLFSSFMWVRFVMTRTKKYNQKAT
ncbi:protein Asterix-like isoform X2 [Varroa jacobsoni]|uniref:Protein Asterix n=1 Tax=Varroa destructor TaxID=109461 RepID=A0A7M7JB26_VARDE|nr:protein Asterix-like isoform X2 [Varroa destructor]XP_022701018.1 protein Asterix-like isoform X2 [Varroa jacobsoni]